MKKGQAYILRALIAVLLVGFTTSYCYVPSSKTTNGSQIHKNVLPESTATFLAEEEIGGQESTFRKNIPLAELTREVRRPLAWADHEEYFAHPFVPDEGKKKFLIHLQLLI